MAFKVARSHIISAIELALDKGGPIELSFKRYKLFATPYRIPKQKGHSGVRVTWEAL
jgi:hypothetical protein